ncbi:MAG TPA: FMN-binding protein [Planctomycetota bacterium]|nr:FMN-binding protein [Planctomycetota bacterium]
MRLVATLSGAGALAGFLLVLVFQATQPTIAAHKEEMLRRAVREVLKEPARFEEIEVKGERVYAGYDAAGRRVGYAIVAAAPGFQDTVRVIFGYDPATRTLIGMKVLESKETPGLGDKIEKEPFVSEFTGATTPLAGIKGGGAGEGVDMITGATISSRTVIGIINRALDRLGPALAEARE